MNRRNAEFAEEVSDLLLTITGLAEIEARKQNVSPYDVDLYLEDCLNIHMTNRMIATEMCASRHFKNLKERGLFIFGRKDNCETVRLNPKFADSEINLLVGRVRMPKNEIIA